VTDMRNLGASSPSPVPQPVVPVPSLAVPSLPLPAAPPIAAGIAMPSLPGDVTALRAAAGQLAAPPTAGVPSLGMAADDADRWTFDSTTQPPGAGVFTRVKSLDGAFELQTATEATGTGEQTTRLAIKVNARGTVVGYDAKSQTLAVDGQPVAVPARGQSLSLVGEGSVTHWGRGFYSVDSAAGDGVSFFDRGGSVDFSGRLAPKRAGAAYGSLGAFGMAPPLAGRFLAADGSVTADPAAFADSWRVSPEASLWATKGPQQAP
jgi:hypothetical protein